MGDSVIQLGGVGGFASEAVVNENALLPKPDGIDFTAAAGVGMTYFTSYYALKQRGQLKAGETMLVMGAAGGVGSTAVELGKVMGAKVIAAASSDEKLELCKQLGADEVINYSTESIKDRIKEITGGKGVDVVYDPVGGDFARTCSAKHGVEWTLSCDRFRVGSDSQHSAEPHATQGVCARWRLLGSFPRRGARGAAAKCRGALGLV